MNFPRSHQSLTKSEVLDTLKTLSSVVEDVDNMQFEAPSTLQHLHEMSQKLSWYQENVQAFSESLSMGFGAFVHDVANPKNTSIFTFTTVNKFYLRTRGMKSVGLFTARAVEITFNAFSKEVEIGTESLVHDLRLIRYDDQWGASARTVPMFRT